WGALLKCAGTFWEEAPTDELLTIASLQKY
ncbi:hypothetical protein V5J37_004705, partial [Endozoicomonas sp. NE43]